ncbi:hypothetical protein ACRYCC_09010 [Actinomadura scrupuli]|uniref:hypothetical protein n=1 Tax=Actinomadura scrupuli TaxID=559629 RepID=UPI003D96DB33
MGRARTHPGTRGGTGVLLTAAALVSGLTMGDASAAAPQWRDDPTPVPQYPGALNQIDAVDARTAWTVGVEENNGQQSAVYRWDGTRWNRQTAPHIVPTDVAGADAGHAWAGGITLTGGAALYWNGTTWNRVDYPGGIPVGIAAAPDGSAWSVGGALFGGGGVVLRWTGSAWAKVTVPLPPGASLTAVAAGSAHDVWISGSAGTGDDVRPFVMHWDGGSWRTIALPVPGDAAHSLIMRIHVVSPADVWAIRSPASSALLHWNGLRWQEIPTPGAVGALSVTDDGGRGAWVVPYTDDDATTRRATTCTGPA